MICYDNIPEELRRLNQWVCVKEGSKVPMQATRPFPASSTNPATWSSFEEAVFAVESGYYDYLGFVFNDNGIVGIDLDDAVGYEEVRLLGQPIGEHIRTVSSLALDILNRCDTYTEVSKSGEGLHLFVKGDIPFKGKNNLAGVEMYKTARFFIMTGNNFGALECVRENQAALDYIVEKYFPETRESKTTTVTPRIYNPEWDSPKGSKRVRIRPNYPVIPDGCRNICLTSLAGMMHSIGYTKGQIYRELQYANNTACKPPLDDGELKAICNSVTRYRR
jgi:primase-polymerase (primpol)-like protein